MTETLCIHRICFEVEEQLEKVFMGFFIVQLKEYFSVRWFKNSEHCAKYFLCGV